MKNITKGQLLVLLGTSANAFTAFMVDPASFGIVEPQLSELRVAKQKLDWSNSIDVDLPEVKNLMSLLVQSGVIKSTDVDAINNYTVVEKEYTINIIPQDTVTLTNVYGAVKNVNGMYEVRADYKIASTGVVITQLHTFTSIPNKNIINATIEAEIKRLKNG